MSRIQALMTRVDWALLRQQKQLLIDLCAKHAHECGKLEGLIHFLDGIQDAVVEDSIENERTVFGE